MAKETIIDSQTARRLLLILSLEGDVKREEIEWALAIIHQIPGYEGVSLAKAVQDRSLKEILVAIAAEQISPTTPKDLETLIEDAKKREAALKTAKETGEKRAEEFIEAAEKAAKTKAQIAEEPVSFGIKITPAALKAFGESAGKAAGTPFKLVSFFSPPKVLAQAPQTTAALASAMSLSQISAKAERLPEGERKQLLRFVENFRQAEFSFYAQVKLQRTPLSVRGMTILMGSEFGMTQGEIVALVHGGAPSERRPSFVGRIGQQIFGGTAQRVVTRAATKAVTSALTKTGISVTTKAVAGGIGKAIGGLIGTAGGPVGTAIGLAVGWVVDKVVGPLINKVIDFISKNKWVLAAPFVLAGLIFGLPWLTVGGIALGGFLLAGGVGPALSMAGGAASSVISGITSLAVASIATPLIVALISIPVLVAIIFFIINSGAYLVPPAPVTDVPFGFPVECTAEKSPVSFSNSTSSPIAKRAWEITADLYQGFWCFWNRSPGDFPEDTTDYPPSYPELFNENLFAKKPNPTRDEISSCGECLFWCTWLVQKAYRENGVSIQYTLWSPTMQADFTRRGKFISARQATPSNVKPGAVIFFDVKNSLDRTDHTGIVHSVNIDGVSYVQSNAGTKDGFVPFGSSGGLQNIPGIDVVGIGNP